MPLGDVAAWEREIRGWLLGRLGKGLTTGESPAAEASLAGRALAWWIFEGKRHPSARSSPRRSARRWNPRASTACRSPRGASRSSSCSVSSASSATATTSRASAFPVSRAQSFADTVHQLKAYRAALREQLPGPLLVWGVVEGGGDRTKAFDAEALRKAAMEREEGQDSWLFTSEGEIREALPALA